MAIIDNKEISGSGFKKTIDEDSMEMILDMTQVSQYQKPHHSAVRETVSNAVDSVIERNLSQNIITGKEKLEDHYDTTKSEGQYKGSIFDPNYYNIKYFHTKEDVYIEYFEKSDERDLIKITDFGVGLGGKRLEKSFNPGYSSKRTSKDTLGSFGIGAKSPLATGAEFYTMTSNHNGRKYKFRIYVNKVDCLIPKFSNGKLNDSHTFENGYHAYYEKTSEKNGVVIEWEIKKHNRDVVSEAIQSQLMYFDNVIFRKHSEWSNSASVIDIKSSILYADNEILVPKETNKYTSKPHILLGKEGKYVNYGPIDFSELELPEYNGGIGFKMSSSDVSISPSRENLVWNEKTKSAILAKFEIVKDLVNRELQDQLKETDFVKWNIIAESINSNLNRNSNNYYGYNHNQTQESLVSVLAKLLTTGDGIALKYSDDYSYKSFGSALTITDENTRTAVRQIYVNDKVNYKLNRQPMMSWNSLKGFDIYVTEDDKADRIKDIHICKGLDDTLSKGFILVHKNKVEEDTTSKLLFDSETLKDYDELEVPEEDRLIYQNKINNADLSPAERRKLDKKVVAKQYKKGYGTGIYTDKVEFRIGDMATDFTSKSIIYGHRDDDTYLRFVASLLPKDSSIKILLVAQGNLKYFKAYGDSVIDYLLEKDEVNQTVRLSDCITEIIRANYIRHTNVSYNKRYLETLNTIFPYEYEVYDKLIEVTVEVGNRRIREVYLSEISNILDEESACNIPGAEHDGTGITDNTFEPLQKLIDEGYTIDYIKIKEYGIADKLNNRLKPYESFINHIENLDQHKKDIDLWLTARGYIKLDKNHGWI